MYVYTYTLGFRWLLLKTTKQTSEQSLLTYGKLDKL